MKNPNFWCEDRPLLELINSWIDPKSPGGFDYAPFGLDSYDKPSYIAFCTGTPRIPVEERCPTFAASRRYRCHDSVGKSRSTYRQLTFVSYL